MARIPVSVASETPQSDDRMTIAAQKGLAKLDRLSPQVEPAPLPLSTPAIDELRGAAVAREFLKQSDTNPAEFDPSSFSVWGAYFRSENTVGSILSSDSLANALFPVPDSPVLTTDDILKRIEADKLGPYQEAFVNVRTTADYAAKKADIQRELEDKRIIQAASGLNSIAAGLAAGIIDLPTLLPGSVGWKLGAAGVGAAKAAAGVAAGAVLGSTVSEIALQASQVDRSWGESAASIGGSLILGGILGGALHTAAYRTLGSATVRRVEDRVEKAVADLANDGEAMKGAGAANVNAWERMRETVNSQRSLNSYGAIESLKALGDIPGFIGKNARIPILDLEKSQSPAAFEALNSLVFRPGVTKANVAGEASGGAPVVAFVRDYRESIVHVAEKADELYLANKSSFKGYADFDAQVTRALVNPGAPSHKAVEETAKLHREVYTRILDDLIEAKILPPSVKERYGDSYFPMIFDADAIRANESTFKALIKDGFAKQFKEEAEAALREKLGRVEANKNVAEGVGVGRVERRPRLDPTTGAPMVDPITGKPKTEKVVVKEGAQTVRDNVTREQYRLRKEYLDEQHALTKDVFEREEAQAVATVNKIHDEMGQNFAAEAADLLDRSARSTELTPAQRARQAREISAQQKRVYDQVEKDRREAIDSVRKAYREQKKDALGKINAEREEAKAILKDNLAVSKAQAQADKAALTVPIRDDLPALRFTRGNKVADDVVNNEAGALAERWYKKTTEWNKDTLEHELEGFTDFLKKRRTPVDHTTMLDHGFVRGNAYSILEDYVRMAGTDAAIARKFKKLVKQVDPATGKVTKESDLIDVGDLKLGSIKDSIVADYDALRNNILASPDFKAKSDKIAKKYEKLVEGKSDAEKVKLAEAAQKELDAAKSEVEVDLANRMSSDIQNVEAIVDAIRGTSKAGASQSFRNAVELVSSFNYVRMLGGTVISSFTDPVKIAIATGLGNTVQGAMLAYQQTFASSWKTAKAVDKGLSRAGAAMAELHLSARLAQMADIANPHRVDSPSVNFMRKASQVFSKVSGITYWNGFWKQVSENATTAYIGQLAHKGWDGLQTSERAWLASLRIDKDGLDLIKQAHLAQVGDKYFDNWPMLMHEGWDDKQAAQLVRHAVGEELNNHVVTPQGYDRMSFATTPTGRVIWQFRQHMVSNQMRFMARQAQLASLDRERTVGLAVGVLGLVTAGATIDFLKQVTGQWSPVGNLDRSKSPLERHAEEWSKTPGLALYNALDRSDTLGIIMEGSNVLDKLIGFGPKSALTIFDDKAKLKEASRFKSRSPLDAVAGPSVGLAGDVVGAANGLKKIVTGGKLSRGDYRSMERLVPGQNIPYLQWLGNSVERTVGDAYSWPNPR